MPQEVPALYDGLSEEDEAQVEDDEGQEEEGTIQLTPDMVNSKFPSISAPSVDDKTKKEEQFVSFDLSLRKCSTLSATYLIDSHSINPV